MKTMNKQRICTIIRQELGNSSEHRAMLDKHILWNVMEFAHQGFYDPAENSGSFKEET